MSGFWQVIETVATVVVAVVLGGWLLYRWLRRSDEPGTLVMQWVLTALNLAFIIGWVAPTVMQGGYFGAFIGVPAAAVAGLIMALIWTPRITGYFGRRVGQLYDGGDVEADPEPFFSIAEARRKQGRYAEAAAEVRTQLERFPNDFKGHLLLAAIEAENLQDLPAASLTIQRFVSQPGHAPRNVAFALTQLADWHLRYAQDTEAARRAFERILALFPDSPEGHLAQQRLAHLSQHAVREENRPPLPLPQQLEHLGLRPDFTGLKIAGRDPAERAAELVQQLEKFPFDNQAREDLAVLYAQEYQRLDLAAEQLEQLLAQPHAPDSQIVRWLNLLADFQLKEAGDAGAAQQALARVVERYPGTPAAETAQRRMATLPLHARAKQESQVVRLGSYEQNLGLKEKS